MGLAEYYYIGCCMHHSSSEMKWNRFECVPPTLNPFVSDSVSISHHGKQKQPCHFSLFRSLWALLSHSGMLSVTSECNVVPDELPNKFTTSEKPISWSWLCDAKQLNVLVYKSCTMISVFFVILCKDMHEIKSLIINNLCEKK